jgi:hypothetical protein
VALYDAVRSVSQLLARESAAVDWNKLAVVEGTTKLADETPLVKDNFAKFVGGDFTQAIALELQARVAGAIAKFW